MGIIPPWTTIIVRRAPSLSCGGRVLRNAVASSSRPGPKRCRPHPLPSHSSSSFDHRLAAFRPWSSSSSSRSYSKSHPSSYRDPTSKRPTRKCDPYGLDGMSLSDEECMTWMSTLDVGWEVIYGDDRRGHNREGGTSNDMDDGYDDVGEGDVDEYGSTGSGVDESHDCDDTTTPPPSIRGHPTSIARHYHHPNYESASSFAHLVSKIATNVDHYPRIIVERLLGGGDGGGGDDRGGGPGWVFRCTVICSTPRPVVPPPTTTITTNTTTGTANSASDDEDGGRRLRRRTRCGRGMVDGVTYHDFHLALCIDVEASREGVRDLLLLPSSRS